MLCTLELDRRKAIDDATAAVAIPDFACGEDTGLGSGIVAEVFGVVDSVRFTCCLFARLVVQRIGGCLVFLLPGKSFIALSHGAALEVDALIYEDTFSTASLKHQPFTHTWRMQ